MTNAIIAALAPGLLAGIADIQAALANIVATPTVENVTAQGEKLALDAINPTNLQTTSIAGLAQEALNLLNALQAHIQTAAAAPTAAGAPTATSGA